MIDKRLTCVATLAAVFITSCGANETVLRSGKETPQANTTAAQTDLERDLNEIANADFRWVFILRRKDGGVIDAEDKGVIRANTAEANRRVSSDNEKAFIIGTNTQIPPEKMAALFQRFAVEDRSPALPPEGNANSNTNSAANK